MNKNLNKGTFKFSSENMSHKMKKTEFNMLVFFNILLSHNFCIIICIIILIL